jgi:hypothetical protein
MKKKSKKKAKALAKRTVSPKKKSKPKPPPAPNPRAVVKKPQSGVLMTDFLKELRKKLIDPVSKLSLWPTAAMPPPAPLADLQAALSIMFVAADQPGPLPPVSGNAGTVENHVTALMNLLDWPATADIPAVWSAPPNRKRQFRYYEVAWAVNFILEAYANSGGGGPGPRDWPPPGPDSN